MTNYDYYINEIMNDVGVDKKTGGIVVCSQNAGFSCNDCIFGNIKHCNSAKKEWLESEYQSMVDWSKVKIDTPIYVKIESTDKWTPRYFAEYKDGEVYAWNDGKTSFTTTARVSWNYAKLAVKEESATDE